LKNHAPYLVELEDGNDFTRSLFTGVKGVLGLWDKELGIFIRSRAGFDEVRKHFRKFTKVQDEHGKWLYWRFWEGRKLPTVLKALKQEECGKFMPEMTITSIYVAAARPRAMMLRLA